MHSYSKTDFADLPVIQFLVILQIKFNSIYSTVRNRLLLQFIHFRKTYSKQRHSTVFQDSQKTSFYSKKFTDFFKFYTIRDLPTRRIILLQEAFNSFIHPAIHIPVSYKTFQGITDILQGSTLIQHSSIRMC